MSIGRRLWLVFLGPLLFIGIGRAQEINRPGPSGTPKITLDVVVSAKPGAAVGGLQQQDFKIMDNKTVQPITSFQAVDGSQTPAEVVLVIDTVNTTYLNVSFERQEISKFLLANGGHLANPTAVALFTQKGTQMQQGFSTDGNKVNEVLSQYKIDQRNLPEAQGFYGAEERFQLSLKALNSLVRHTASQPGRKIIIWLSPGWPLLTDPSVNANSNVSFSEQQRQTLFSGIVNILTLLRESRTTLYSLNSLGTVEGIGNTFNYLKYLKGVTKPAQAEPGYLALQVLALQSGGDALNSTGVEELLKRCIAENQTYYELSFEGKPAERRDDYHHVEVQVGRPGMTVRSLQSYYAQP
jgi:VWFA-related protein